MLVGPKQKSLAQIYIPSCQIQISFQLTQQFFGLTYFVGAHTCIYVHRMWRPEVSLGHYLVGVIHLDSETFSWPGARGPLSRLTGWQTPGLTDLFWGLQLCAVRLNFLWRHWEILQVLTAGLVSTLQTELSPESFSQTNLILSPELVISCMIWQ